MKNGNNILVSSILLLFLLEQVYCFNNYTEFPFTDTLENLNNSLKANLTNGNMEAAARVSSLIINRLNSSGNDSLTVADSYYYVGVYFTIINSLTSANQYLHLSASLKERLKIIDEIYAKALYNLGGNYARLGVFSKHKELTTKSLNIEKQIYGNESGKLVSTYGSVIAAYMELKDFKQATEFAEIAVRIAESDTAETDDYSKAYLYNTLGILYNAIGDYYKGMIFLEKSEEFYTKAGATNLNLLYNLSYSLMSLGFSEKAEIYRKKCIDLAMNEHTIISYHIISMYANELAESGNKAGGEKILSDIVKNIEKKFGSNSQSYFEALSFYADYLREFNIDDIRALNLYKQCIDFFDKNRDSFLRFFVKTGYATLLSKHGNYEEAIATLQSLLFLRDDVGILDNPSIDNINIDKDHLNVLRTKHRVLKDYYQKNRDIKTLEASINTAELIIELIDKLRITISGEESRLLLGSNYRDLYIDIIGDLLALHNLTSNNDFKLKAFKYVEKSKIAALLTATRELTAVEYHIPEELANEEKNLQSEISILNDRIAGKSEYGIASDEIVKIWRQNLFDLIRRHDALIKTFEEKFPGYYDIKYNTNVAMTTDIPKFFGRRENYLTYVAADTIIFIGVVNRKNFNIISINVDSTFYNSVQKFRNLLIAPDFNNVSTEIQEFKTLGFHLYNMLIAPALPYLISNNLTISPDNFLSYIPFEVIPVNDKNAESNSYKKIDYMMNTFDISYTYSATLHGEIIKRKLKTNNGVLAFAPEYLDALKIENILQNRQTSNLKLQTSNLQSDILADLPFARSEADYVYRLLGGKLYTNKEATKSMFKSEASQYGILHLAMHAVINDDEPMYSTLVFSNDESSEFDNRLLRAFEIYGIPLKARMVMLSSCNTGTGKLYSGEGILSLARGFVFSGSESVVMSMWEVDDRAGSEIVKLYYGYLKKGYSKSLSLKKARTDFLKSADQLRSHPYFWSALTVYGVNDSLFLNRALMITVVALLIIIAAVVYFLRKRIRNFC